MSITLFICGTISDKRGFEYKKISGNELPGDPSRYLDKYDPKTMDKDRTYLINKEKIAGDFYTIVHVMEGINPNDQETNRGSYIAVGILTNKAISLNTSTIIFEKIAEIHGVLKGLRDNRNAFNNKFRLADLVLDINIELYRNESIDLPGALRFYSSVQNIHPKIVYNDYIKDKKDYKPHFSNTELTNELQNKEKEIIYLKNELNRISSMQQKKTKIQKKTGHTMQRHKSRFKDTHNFINTFLEKIYIKKKMKSILIYIAFGVIFILFILIFGLGGQSDKDDEQPERTTVESTVTPSNYGKSSKQEINKDNSSGDFSEKRQKALE
jgi:hypothetical protein